MEKKDSAYQFPSLKFYNKSKSKSKSKSKLVKCLKQYEPKEFSINVIGGGGGRTKMQVMKGGVGQVVMQI